MTNKPISIGNGLSAWLPVQGRDQCANGPHPLSLPKTRMRHGDICYLCSEKIAEERAEAVMMG